jgi:hypothetical protein
VSRFEEGERPIIANTRRRKKNRGTHNIMHSIYIGESSLDDRSLTTYLLIAPFVE